MQPLSLLGQLSVPLGHGVLRNDYLLCKGPILELEIAFCFCSDYKAKENTEIRDEKEHWPLGEDVWVAVGEPSFVPVSFPNGLQS